MSPRITHHASRIMGAFTLMEVMLALTVSAIVLAAIGGVFFAALRLRDRTAAALDETTPLYQAFSIIRRDFQGALPPGAASLPTAGDFKTDPESASRVQLFTTTALVNDTDPWGDVQEVMYDLRESADHRQSGQDLYRTVSRNVLASGAAEGVEVPLLSHVQSLEFACFDGSNWRDSWDTSISDTNLPVAVRIRVRLAGDSDANSRVQQPYELVIPLLAQSRTNQPQTSTTGGAQ
jgi:type II secretory pathway component PulJ